MGGQTGTCLAFALLIRNSAERFELWLWLNCGWQWGPVPVETLFRVNFLRPCWQWHCGSKKSFGRYGETSESDDLFWEALTSWWATVALVWRTWNWVTNNSPFQSGQCPALRQVQDYNNKSWFATRINWTPIKTSIMQISSVNQYFGLLKVVTRIWLLELGRRVGYSFIYRFLIIQTYRDERRRY